MAGEMYETGGMTMASELESHSVHLKLLSLEGGAYPARGEDAQGAAEDVSERIRRERSVLLCDLNSVKAKFELTLQTLRSFLRLGADASWADVLEHVEALADCRSGPNTPRGLTAAQVSANEAQLEREEKLEAELERDQLEDKLEAQASHITRLRELLQKQQRLLDMTAGQIADQHQQSKTQAEQITHMEQKEQEIRAAQAAKIEALTAHCERLQLQAHEKHELATQLDEQFRNQAHETRQNSLLEEARINEQAERIQELQEQLAIRDSECKRSRADVDRQKLVIKELTDSLAKQNEAHDQMRDQLQVYEAADRRHYSYATRTPPDHRSRGATEDLESPAPGSPRAQASARSIRSARQEQFGSGDLDVYPSGSATSRGRPSPQVGVAPRAVQSARQAPMDDNERDAFLSHFPMASRTERQMRNRLDGERRKKLGR